MILVDYSQNAISAITADPKLLKEVDGNENLMKHLIFNSIREINLKFKKEYGELIICCDDRNNYWRKMIFPNYKQNRKKDKEDSRINWDFVYSCMDVAIKDLTDNFPYKVVKARAAEADDVIAVLTKRYHKEQPILIVSADGDYMQLQKYENVRQYSKRAGKFLETDDPVRLLKEKILRGDSGDGIPSFINPENCLVEKVKQKPLYQTRIDEILQSEDIISKLSSIQEIERYKKNKRLIDFDCIPDLVEKEIFRVFDSLSVSKVNLNTMFMFLVKNHMSNLAGSVEDFRPVILK